VGAGDGWLVLSGKDNGRREKEELGVTWWFLLGHILIVSVANGLQIPVYTELTWWFLSWTYFDFFFHIAN
jgi:hypothetical protein